MFLSRIVIFLGGFLLSLLFSFQALSDTPDSLIQKAQYKNLAYEKQWLDLLHMEKSLWGGYRSSANGDLFFLSKSRTDPSQELDATIHRIFESDGACRFPARWLFLKKHLGLDDTSLPRVHCDKFLQFRQRINAHSVSLIFSSYYLNNPSSAFGHTFIRFGQTSSPPSNDGKTEQFELLDYGIGYAANTTTSNAILYAFYGLFGFFQGTWSSIPYYYKVREYNDFESRDIWSYSLHFSQDELEMLVAHLWELGSTSFDYFYFTRNCSFEIMKVLEAAKPDLQIVEALHTHVIPSDTLKIVYESPGLVTAVSYRPSIRAQLFARFGALTTAEKMSALKVIRKKDLSQIPDGASDVERARILDTAIDGLDFKDPKDELKTFKSQLLRARSRLPVVSEKLSISPSPLDQPHLGHRSHRVALYGGASSRYAGYSQINFRFAHHDFGDQITGYPEYASIEFISFQGRYNWQDNSVWFEDASLFQIKSWSPWNRLERPLSWEIKVGAETERDERCSNCIAGVAELGGGLTVNPFSKLISSLMLDGKVFGSPNFTGGGVQFSAGPKLSLVYRIEDSWQLTFESKFLRHFREDFKYSWTNELQVQKNFGSRYGLRLIAKNLNGPVLPSENEAALGVLHYF